MQARTKSMGIVKADVMKRLFSTAIKAGQHNVPAQEVFLEENGRNVGGCSACDVITLS